MDASQTAGLGAWRYLINPDKSASPQLEQLCLGLAKVISTLEPGPNDELTPQRLASFYRAVGGNYDSLFLKTSDGGLSFMYQTLGCFHSLQPTSSPFQQPRIPCLSPAGFARWQTIQILLCPEENVGFMQKAVQRWNVPTATGGIFPKYIPNEVFPSKPDEEMERWHKMVTGQLNQKNYMRRLKNSPYQSPRIEPSDRRDGYFSGAQVGKPARHSRSSSRDDQDRLAAYRRRSSVPDFPSPPAERGSHWDARNNNEAKKVRSHSAQRSPPQHSRQRSYTASGPPPAPSHKSPASKRPGVTTDPSGRRGSAYNSNYRSPAHSPSTVEEDSGSEASSETSQTGRRRTPGEDRKNRRSSLWMPSFMRSHKRRHSSDASYRAPGPKHSQSLRPDQHSSRTPKVPVQTQQPPYRGGDIHQWRDTVWNSEPTISTPPTPVQPQAQPDPRAPAIRYPDQSNLEPLTRETSSGSGTDQRHRSSDWERPGAQRRHAQHALPRPVTVTGVKGRKYPTTEPQSPVERQRSHASRGSVAAMV